MGQPGRDTLRQGREAWVWVWQAIAQPLHANVSSRGLARFAPGVAVRVHGSVSYKVSGVQLLQMCFCGGLCFCGCKRIAIESHTISPHRRMDE